MTVEDPELEAALQNASDLDRRLLTGSLEAAREVAREMGPHLDRVFVTENDAHHQLALAPPGWPQTRKSLSARQRALLLLLDAFPERAIVRRAVADVQVLRLQGIARANVSSYGDRYGFDLSAVEHFPALTTLHVSYAKSAGRLRSQTLTRLDVDSAFADLTLHTPALESLELRSSVVDLSRMRAQELATALPRLAEVFGNVLKLPPGPWAFPSAQKIWVAGLQAETLDIRAMPMLHTLSITAATKELLGFDGHATLRELKLATDHAATQQWSLPALLHLSLTGWTGGFRPGAFPELTHVHARSAKIGTIDGLAAACPKLQHLDLSACHSLHDIRDVAGHPTLEVLDLQHSTHIRDLRGLEPLPALRTLKLRGTTLTKSKIPKSFHHAVVPERLVAVRKRRKSTAAKPAPRTGKPRKRIAEIRKMLLSRDFDRIDRGIELALALDSTNVFDGLLEGTGHAEGRGHLSARFPWAGPVDVFVPNAVFEYRAAVVAPYRQHALRKLVAFARPGSHGATLRRKFRRLLLRGVSTSSTVLPVDLTGLEHFTELELLAVDQAFPVHGLDVLPHLERLKTLLLHSVRLDLPGKAGGDGSGALALPPSLRELRIFPHEDGNWVHSSWSNLEVLHLPNATIPPAALGHIQGLRELRWDSQSQDVVSFALTQPHLESLELISFAGDLNPLTELMKLRRLAMPAHLDFAALPVLPHLEWLQSGIGTDFEALAKQPSLKQLHLGPWGERVDGKKLAKLGLTISTDRQSRKRLQNPYVLGDHWLEV